MMIAPPPAAIEFLTKIREVIAIAKQKMAAKRFIPSLLGIPEEDSVLSIEPAYSKPASSRRGSMISLKRENSRRKTCTGCPGCEPQDFKQLCGRLPEFPSLAACRSCTLSASESKQRSIRKWLEDVPIWKPEEAEGKFSDGGSIKGKLPKRVRSPTRSLSPEQISTPIRALSPRPASESGERIRSFNGRLRKCGERYVGCNGSLRGTREKLVRSKKSFNEVQKPRAPPPPAPSNGHVGKCAYRECSKIGHFENRNKTVEHGNEHLNVELQNGDLNLGYLTDETPNEYLRGKKINKNRHERAEKSKNLLVEQIRKERSKKICQTNDNFDEECGIKEHLKKDNVTKDNLTNEYRTIEFIKKATSKKENLKKEHSKKQSVRKEYSRRENIKIEHPHLENYKLEESHLDNVKRLDIARSTNVNNQKIEYSEIEHPKKENFLMEPKKIGASQECTSESFKNTNSCGNSDNMYDTIDGCLLKSLPPPDMIQEAMELDKLEEPKVPTITKKKMNAVIDELVHQKRCDFNDTESYRQVEQSSPEITRKTTGYETDSLERNALHKNYNSPSGK